MRIKKYSQGIKFQPKGKYLKTYLILAVLRVCLVFLPQIGYIHPDEFFQSVEIPTGEYTNLMQNVTFQIKNDTNVLSVVCR